VEPGASRHDIGRPVTPIDHNHQQQPALPTGSDHLTDLRKIEAKCPLAAQVLTREGTAHTRAR
jgi:hypothetical protein